MDAGRGRRHDGRCKNERVWMVEQDTQSDGVKPRGGPDFVTWVQGWYNLRRGQSLRKRRQGFPGGAVVENLPASAGDTGSSPGLGRSHMPRSN